MTPARRRGERSGTVSASEVVSSAPSTLSASGATGSPDCTLAMDKFILIIGTFDTKADELNFVRDRIAARGFGTRTLDAGVFHPSPPDVDVPNAAVSAAGGRPLQELADRRDRGEAVAVMARGAAKLTRDLFDRGEISGVLALGGGSGTVIGTSAMRTLPLGVPKVMVSSMASGNVRPYVGTSDIAMMHSVVDISGLNRISRRILGNAALAVCGMLESGGEAVSAERPLIAATMFGVTTPCVEEAKHVLEEGVTRCWFSTPTDPAAWPWSS